MVAELLVVVKCIYKHALVVQIKSNNLKSKRIVYGSAVLVKIKVKEISQMSDKVTSFKQTNICFFALF